MYDGIIEPTCVYKWKDHPGRTQNYKIKRFKVTRILASTTGNVILFINAAIGAPSQLPYAQAECDFRKHVTERLY